MHVDLLNRLFVQPMCKITVTTEYITDSCCYGWAYSSPTGKYTIFVHYHFFFPGISICKLSCFHENWQKILCQVYSLEYNLVESSFARSLSHFLCCMHIRAAMR